MYVINQKASHFPNNVPNGPMYFPDNGMHPAGQMINDQMPFSPCIPSIMPSINNHNQMQSNMSRFINPQNANSIRQHSIMTSTMMAQANKNQKSAMIACSIPDETSMQYQTGDNFPSMTTSYKSRNTSLDSSQNNTINNTNLGSDVINTPNIPADPNIGIHVSNTNRSQTPRNKRSRTNNNNNNNNNRATPPCAKEACSAQTAMVSSHNNNGIRPSSTNMNVMPLAGPGVPQHKCLPPTPLNGTLPMQYNMVDMVPQQIRQRMPVNVINTYGCNRPQMIDKNMTIFPPGTHPNPMFNASAHNVPPFYSQIDNGLPLPMFHLHSRLSKLQECDRLTFPVNHGNLWGPQTLRHGDQVTEIQFELSQDNLQQIISRSDLDIVVTSFTHRDQFRLCHWPDFLELRINGHLLSLDTTVMQDLKVHMPCCIKRYCKLGINILQFTVTKCVCCHLFHAFMVHRPTLQHAIETIQTKSTSSVITKSLLSEIYLRNPGLVNASDDSNNVCVVNLICPMSQVRISIPARTKFCKHIQPFDLQEFLKVQTKWPQYFCPICRVRVTFNLNEYVQNIIVDDVIRDIINKVDLTVKRVICYPDGKWKPAVDINSSCGVPFVPPNLSDNHNHESNYQTIRQSPIAARSSNLSPMSVHSKQTICIDQMGDKKSKLLPNPLEYDCINTDIKSNKSPCINNISSSTMPSPAPPRNLYGNSMTTVDSLSRSETPLTSAGIEPSPPKRNKISPHQVTGESFPNMPTIKFANNNSNESMVINEIFSRNINPYQTENFSVNQNLNFGSPESIKTPLSTTSVSSASQVTSIANISSQALSVFPNQIKPSLANSSFPTSQIVSSTREQSSLNHHETDTSHISSTTGSGTSITSIRPPTSVNGDNVNKQASSGSSDPSSPPEFFDPHSATTNYDDDDNSSLHLQRLIGFIDEILSEEEEYVLDTQWASFTWPSADKSLDLLHLSDIEKFL